MADKAVVTQTTLDAIGQAIIAKGGAAAPMTPAQMPAAIATIPTGKPNSEGTPDDGWKNDGASHFWNYGDEDGWTFQICIGKVVGAPVTIDWGDGQSETLDVSTSSRLVTHVYSSKGAYRVDVVSDEGGSVTFGNGSVATVSGDHYNNGTISASLHYTHVEFGSNADQSNGYSQFAGFMNLIGLKTECIGAEAQNQNRRTSLRYCDIGEGWMSFGNMFNGSSVYFKRFTFPKSVTSATSAFYGCFGVEEIDFAEPSEITSLNATLRGIRTLKKVTIPSSVTTLTNYALAGLDVCEDGLEIHFKGTTPPTVSNSSVIALNSSAKIYVPYSSDHSILAAYKAEPNLSVYASQIFEEEE